MVGPLNLKGLVYLSDSMILHDLEQPFGQLRSFVLVVSLLASTVGDAA